MAQFSKFQQVLENVESLSLDEQEALIDLVCRRLKERRREEIAANITQAQIDYRTGNVVRGSVTEIMAELQE